MQTYEFFAHGTASLYGAGIEIEAAKLTQLMNKHRSINVWQFRETDERDQAFDIAAEIQRHMEA